MTASLNLGRIWGIPIGLHWSLLLVFALLTSSLGAGYFPDQYPDLAAPTAWLLAVITSVLFFGSVLLHELGHAWVALRNQIPVNGVTLFIFGGVAQLGKMSPTAGVEFRVAVGGPIVSLVLTLLFGAVWLLVRDVDALAAPSVWLARINLMLLLFNLIPGYPLDGGRILRAAVWHFSGDERRGLRVALVAGQIVAFGFMGIGALIILNGRFADGVWLIFIGWFLQNATAAEQSASTVESRFGAATVAQAVGMTTEPQVPGRLKLRQLVEDHVLASGQSSFLVVDGDQPRGVVTLRDVAKIPRDRWDWVSVAEVMAPWTSLQPVRPDARLLAALRIMDDSHVSHLPVMDGERLIGLLTREEILRYVRLRAELGV